jgi:hypothetical protein
MRCLQALSVNHEKIPEIEIFIPYDVLDWQTKSVVGNFSVFYAVKTTFNFSEVSDSVCVKDACAIMLL